MFKRFAHLTYKAARRVVITVVGATVLLLGFVMIVTPGPAIVVIPAGLAILSIEWAWARSLLRRAREEISRRNSSSHAARADRRRDHAES